MVARPPKRPASRQTARATIEYESSVSQHLRSAHRLLAALARHPAISPLRRSLARMAAVVAHRLTLLDATSGDDDVDPRPYLTNTLDVASRTASALLDAEVHQ